MVGRPAEDQARSESAVFERDDRTVARFTALYTDQYQRVVAYAKRRVGDLGAAEDIAADVFRIAWEHTIDTVPEPGWLFATARNTVMHYQRSAARAGALAEAAGQEANRRMTLQVDQDEQVTRVREALEELPADQRELLMAYYLDGLSGTECGNLLNCSVGAVWVRLHRARNALKAQFEAVGDLRASGPTHRPARPTRPAASEKDQR